MATTKRFLIGGMLILVLGIVLFGGAYFESASFRSKVDGASIATQMPKDMRDASFFTGPNKPVYHVQGLSFAASSTFSPSFAWQTSPGGTEMVLAFAATSTSRTDPMNRFSVVRFIRHGNPLIVGHGYAPAYLDDTHISYFTNDGMVVMNLSSGATTLIMRYASANERAGSVVYSPDRTLVLWSNGTHAYLARINPISYREMYAFTTDVNRVLTNNAIYEIRLSKSGSELWGTSFTGAAHHILTIPAYFSVQSVWL